MVIYKVTNLLNGMIYVGQDTKNRNSYYGSGLLVKRAINKYGKENFTKEILEVCDTKKQLNEREKYWINKLNCLNDKIGYNLAEGGHGGLTYTDETKKRISELFKNRIVSDETKKKMSESKKGKKFHTEVSKAKISSIHKGKKLSKEHVEKIREFGKNSPKSKEFLEHKSTIHKYWTKGSKHTDETKKKMSEYHKANPVKYWLGKKRPLDAIEKAKQSNKGFKHSEEHKQKIRGENNYFYGKNHTEETKLKMRETISNRTPEQKLECYKKFYISRMKCEPTEEQLRLKLEEIKNRK